MTGEDERKRRKGKHRDRDRPDSPRRLPRWKKALLALAVVLMVVGVAAQGYLLVRGEPVAQVGGAAAAGDASGSASDSGGGGSGLQRSLVQGLDQPGVQPAGAPEAGGGPDAAEPDPSALEAWSPTIFRLGFSFFVGFCLGFVFRTFLKLSIFAVGLLLLLLFGLQYAGVIDVDMDQLKQHYETAMSWLQTQTVSFGEFVKGYLPSAGSGAAGLVVGFKKK